LTFTDKSTKAADEVTDDAWNYGISVGSGFISFGNGSPFVEAFRDSEDPNFSSFYLNSGPVVDQTFMQGGNPVSTNVTAFVGGLNYDGLFN
jgi:hypothetical protein